jgi:hypothetical protein
MIAVVALSLAAAACNDGTDQPSTDGSAPVESAVRTGASPVGTYNAGYSEFTGFSGYLQLMSDGTGRVLSMGAELSTVPPVGTEVSLPLATATEDVFEYRIDGDRLIVTSGEQTTWDCDPAESGIYEWARVESVLELEPVDEPCATRAAAMQPEFDPADPVSWWSMGDVPIVEMRPGDDPVSVETPIGTIEWALVEEQPALSFLAFDGGFVALTSAESGDIAAGDAAPAEVVVSADGRTWTPLPPPPVVPEWLGTRGSEVWVASGVFPGASGATAWPPLVYVTDDNGSNWREVPIDPAPPGVEPQASGSALGPAGALFMSAVGNNPPQEQLVWVLGSESFEPVTPPFEGSGVSMSIEALDSGFLAHTRQYASGTEIPGSFWTSADGRSWTEEAAVPSDFSVQGTYGDTVYGSIGATTSPWIAESVTSLDGGRTWQSAPPRPDGPLDVSDIGLVAVDDGGGLVCFSNAFVSSDSTQWARALAPWPLTRLAAPVISGDTILIPSFDCTGDGEETYWIGTLVQASATTDDTVRP